MANRVEVRFIFGQETFTRYFGLDSAANLTIGTKMKLVDTPFPNGTYKIIDRGIDFGHTGDTIDRIILNLSSSVLFSEKKPLRSPAPKSSHQG